jgi:1,4-alpha-glucan branching enzyme
MGNEIGQGREWQARWELDWALLAIDWHAGVQRMLRDLNRLHASNRALHELDFTQDGFSWVDCHDADHSTLSFLRRARDGSQVLAALNFTPVPRHNYRIGLPAGGMWREIFNSDSAYYSGSNVGNGAVYAEPLAWMGLPFSAAVTLPPLAGIILEPVPG